MNPGCDIDSFGRRCWLARQWGANPPWAPGSSRKATCSGYAPHDHTGRVCFPGSPKIGGCLTRSLPRVRIVPMGCQDRASARDNTEFSVAERRMAICVFCRAREVGVDLNLGFHTVSFGVFVGASDVLPTEHLRCEVFLFHYISGQHVLRCGVSRNNNLINEQSTNYPIQRVSTRLVSTIAVARVTVLSTIPVRRAAYAIPFDRVPILPDGEVGCQHVL